MKRKGCGCAERRKKMLAAKLKAQQQGKNLKAAVIGATVAAFDTVSGRENQDEDQKP
jgi:hypothetical protein